MAMLLNMYFHSHKCRRVQNSKFAFGPFKAEKKNRKGKGKYENLRKHNTKREKGPAKCGIKTDSL